MSVRLALLLVGAALLTGCAPPAPEQQFAGLGALAASADGFRQASPGTPLQFPEDHGAHPDFRIEWWYLTANLEDAEGRPYGAQWTLFRSAQQPAPASADTPWQDPQVYMAHFAITTPDDHHAFQRYARGGEHGGLARAGAQAVPFKAWLDDWYLASADPSATNATWTPLVVHARQDRHSVTLRLEASRPLVLQGDKGFSQKHPNGGGSHYYSQPYLSAEGTLGVNGETIAVNGQAWLDREWSSQFLQADQSGWDWFALHLDSGEKLMLFQLRNSDDDLPSFQHGVLIAADGQQRAFDAAGMTLEPVEYARVAGRELPIRWQLQLADIDRNLTIAALHPQQWLAVDFAYWEGYVVAEGESPGESGRGYLEMVGY